MAAKQVEHIWHASCNVSVFLLGAGCMPVLFLFSAYV
jgi:hypothetical protein